MQFFNDIYLVLFRHHNTNNSKHSQHYSFLTLFPITVPFEIIHISHFLLFYLAFFSLRLMAEKNRMLDLQNDGLESIQPDRF